MRTPAEDEAIKFYLENSTWREDMSERAGVHRAAVCMDILVRSRTGKILPMTVAKAWLWVEQDVPEIPGFNT